MVKYLAYINSNTVTLDANGTLGTEGIKTSTIEHTTSGFGSVGEVITADGTGGWSWSQPSQTQGGTGGATEINDLTDGKTIGTSHYLGNSAGSNDNTGLGNVGIGYNALQNNNNSMCVAIGYQAAKSSTGSDNISIGADSLSTASGSKNVAIGKHSLYSASTGAENVAIGVEANYYTNSNYSVTVGRGAQQFSSESSVAIGYKASENSTGNNYNNTSIGTYAFRNGIGYNNVSIGHSSLYSINNSGKSNTGVGSFAMYSNTTGEDNVGLGTYALSSNTNGSKNTAIGAFVAYNARGNSHCVFVGQNANPSGNDTTNEIVIGSGTTGYGSNTVTLGDGSITHHYLSSVTIGEQGHGSDHVGISSGNHASTYNYMIMQQRSTGDVFLNAPSTSAINVRIGNIDKMIIDTSFIDIISTTKNTGHSSTTDNTLHHYLGKVNNAGTTYFHVNAGTSSSPYSWGGYPGFLCWQGNGEIRIHGNGSTYSCAIRVDGGYLTFTGSHDTFTPFREEDIGKIVYSTGNYATEFKDGVKYNKISIMDSCPIVSLTTTENDKRVIGVLSKIRNQQISYEITDIEYSNLEDKSGYIQSNIDPKVYIKNVETDVFNRGHYNAIGEGGIWVSNKNGNLENGDYITSSTIPGYGQRQNDDLLRNYTVAKITCDCDFTEIVVVTKNHKITDNHYEYDENGNPVYENVLDEQGNETTHLKYELRYLLANGTQITKEEYSTRNDAYIAAFVGCTYHCG